MSRIDPRAELAGLYRGRTGVVVEVDVPPLRYLMVDGEGDPNTSQAYAEAVEALFSVSYRAKFMVKKGPSAVDYRVMPLKGLWWADDVAAFEVRDKARWRWTMMVHQPDVISLDVIGEAVEGVRARQDLPAPDRLRVETLSEGRCAQVLHVGPFDEEGPVVERLHAFVAERSALRGTHHEVYLSDVRRAAPENWRTIIRQPMA